MKFYRIIIMILLSIFISTVSLASNQYITVIVDGVKLNTDSPATIVNGSTLVPMRSIFEAMGANIDWDQSQKTVRATRGDAHITMTVGGPYAYVNGRSITLDAKAVILNNRTMVPVRFISEALGASVEWDGKSKTVTITSKYVEPNYVTLNGITTTMGDSIDQVEKQLGKADRIDDSFYDYKWHVYNRDYNNFIMVGIGNGVVEGIYTNSRGFEVNGIKYGDIISHTNGRFNEDFEKERRKNLNQLVTVYLDKHENYKVHACLISVTGKRKEIRNDYELIKAQELQNFDATNAFRANYNKSALKFDNLLHITAKEHSRDMADKNYFSHTNLEGLSSSQRYKNNGGLYSSYGENISAGRESGLDALDGWINSIGHRDNILIDREFLGVGFGYNELSQYKFYMTQNLMSPRNY